MPDSRKQVGKKNNCARTGTRAKLDYFKSIKKVSIIRRMQKE
jgi:hypothetical protein